MNYIFQHTLTINYSYYQSIFEFGAVFALLTLPLGLTPLLLQNDESTRLQANGKGVIQIIAEALFDKLPSLRKYL
jgi:hypothetical protein